MSMSKIRESLFPIHGRKEVTKFLLLGFMKFFIIFVLTLTRDTKDTLVVTQCGAEAIAFLKVYGVLPAAAAFIAIFAKMSSALSRQSLFYATCIPFFLFFFVFNSTIYPNRQFLEPSISTIETKLSMMMDGEGVPAKILNHWTSALFFVVSEVYASVSIGILFWKFANDVVSVREAKRFYPLFAYMSSLAPIAAGQYVVRYASQTGDFASSLNRLTIPISMAGIAICCLHHIINVFVERTEDTQNLPAKNDDQKGTKKKNKMNMMDSLRFLSSSHYLGLVTTLVLGYGIMYNFLEISWKSLVKRQYDDPIEYQRFMGNFSSLVGASTLVVILIGSNIIKLLGWRVGAISTPAIMSLLAIPFFACTVVLGVDDNPTVLNAAVQIGSVMILMSRACKYGLFDPTLQMSYIPLDEDSKVKGKAAIDVLGSRVGKSGASMVQQGFVFAFGDIISASPAVMVVFYAVSAVWILGAMKLSVLYDAKAKEQEGMKKD
mmetsp:Transcript_21352/g.25434  ORF Transcript_21352/g.25434 Transcript_21352/m.25434 type:complete len:490 (-) Transcript_21352:273-1742(-)